MKITELKKIVEEENCEVEVGHIDTRIMFEDNILGWINNTKQDYYNISYNVSKVIAQAILDYAYTPLEEREEEKKYYLKSKVKGQDLTDLFLVKGGQLYNYEMYLSICLRSQFTQKEIDEMPFDTKFFEKVEVK